MKRIVLFTALWLNSILAALVIWKNESESIMLMMILATQLAYIIYRQILEEKE